MSAIYKIYFNFCADDTAGCLKDRDQYIGLKGGFGTFLMGSMSTPYKATTASWDPFLATFLQARGNNGMSTLHNSYGSNVLAYANKVGKTKFTVGVNVDDTDADADGENDANHGFHLGVNAAVADSIEVAFAVLTESADPAGQAIKLGARWKGDGMSAAAQYETEDEDLGDRNHIYANFVKSLGEGASVAIALGSSKDNSDASNHGSYVSLGYKKAIDKKLSWHAGVVQMTDGVVGKDNSANQVGAGMRLKF